MADRFFYLEFGGDSMEDVTEAGSDSAGADVSLRITYDATNNSKMLALKAIDAIRAAVVADNWPPA